MFFPNTFTQDLLWKNSPKSYPGKELKSALRTCFRVEREESEAFDRGCNSLCKVQTFGKSLAHISIDNLPPEFITESSCTDIILAKSYLLLPSWVAQLVGASAHKTSAFWLWV